MIKTEQKRFGNMPDGRVVMLYSFTNEQGLTVRMTNLGGIITSILVPDRTGRTDDIVLGFEKLESYIEPQPYFGAIVGRYANRIAAGKLIIAGKHYQLTLNHGRHHLHGGFQGFDKVLWQPTVFQDDERAVVQLDYISPEGEEGYPGTLTVRVTYTLTNTNHLIIRSTAWTDRTTVVNLSFHSYFNLAGPDRNTILDHYLQLEADHYLEIDADLIPGPQLCPVSGTPFDFRQPVLIGAHIGEEHPQLLRAGGYDHTFVLRTQAGPLQRAGRLSVPETGRSVDIYTTEPGLQLYTGNGLDGSLIGKKGTCYGRYAGLCLETQHFPNSPNNPQFPTTVLEPDAVFDSETRYVFQYNLP
ncbi:galactose mutarotase [bacterium]|nr:galactose mutarotase [bacterium]